MSNCSEELPYTSQLYPELRGDATVIALAVIVVLLLVLTIANYVEELWFFFRVHPHGPNRNYVISILTLFPVLSLCCVLALFVPRSSLVMEFFASTLRAIGIYVFLKILIGYFGDDGKLLAEMELPVTFRSPPCCCCCVCMKSSTLNSQKLKISKILCFQLVITRPCTMLILILLWVDNKYKQTDEVSLKVQDKLKPTNSLEFRGEGNKIQFNFNEERLRGLELLSQKLISSDFSGITNLISSEKEAIRHRNKILRIADNHGWGTVKEYVDSDFADNNEDAARLRPPFQEPQTKSDNLRMKDWVSRELREC
eukprot:XP_011433697.1 PREDICTED: organic solute transporter subunit alpha-like [Crassostrea gigas]